MNEFEKVALFPTPCFVDKPAPFSDNKKVKQPQNYSSVLMTKGYADSSTLVPILRSWLHFIATLDSDLVIADDSPTALLAARLLNVPSIMIGEGYTVPPTTETLNSVSPWREATEGAISVQGNCFFEDQHLLNAINGALKSLGFHDIELTEAQQLFSNAAQWVVSLPELDHYGARDLPYVVRWTAGSNGSNPVWPTVSGEKVFVYMDIDTPHITELLIQLTAIGDPVLAVIPNATDEFIQQYKAENLHIQRRQVDIKAVLKQCDTVINHGGHDLVYELLLLGIPCILVPNCHENNLLSYRLAKQRLCFAGPVMPSKLNVVSLLKAARARGVEWDNAAALARKYTDNNGLIRLHDLIAEKFFRS